MNDYDWNRTFFDSIAKMNNDLPNYSFSQSSRFGQAGLLTHMEKDALGSLKGKKVLHFMCHIGAESTALSSLGADVTGIDLCESALKIAKKRASYLRSSAKFILGDCRNASQLVGMQKFDVIYIGLGSIGWISNLNQLFQAASSCLYDGGKIVMFEIHPISQTRSAAEKTLDIKASTYDLGAVYSPIYCTYKKSWASEKKSKNINGFYIWKHTLGNIITSLANASFSITELKEFDETSYQQFDELIQTKNKTWAFEYPKFYPLSFTLTARKVHITPKILE